MCNASRSTRPGSRLLGRYRCSPSTKPSSRLESVDPNLARIIELRAFGGLTIEDAAHVLKVSPSTVKRDWRTAKAWLNRELGRSMTEDRWQRVKALFEAAVERPPAERTAFLAAAAGEDDALRGEVESLLAADTRDDPAIDRLPIAAGVLQLSSPPQRVGPYDVVGLIGAGAMGEVYRARDTKLKRDVALKVLPPLLALDPDRVARFKREAQVLAALNHPNIAAIYGLEDADDRASAGLELVEGRRSPTGSRAGRFPLEEALAIARQIAEALEAAHEKGIIHRDLKPANVKITPTAW